MKFGKAGFARRLLEQNTGLIFGGEQLTSATEPTERVVMKKSRHEGNDTRLPAVLSAPRA